MTVDELITLIKYKTDESSVKKAESTADQLAGKIGGSFKSVVTGMAGLILPAAGIGGMAMLAVKAVTTASSIERLTAQYSVMLGSMGAAKNMIKDIQELAASTPLTSLGISETVKQLLAFGIKGKDAISTVRMLGDVAGGDQQRLGQLGYAYGQTMTAGRLMGQDLMQYMNVGFNPLKVMAENAEKFGLRAGISMTDLREEMSKGKISAEMVKQAFELATSEGGMFYQNMAKQSQTLGGLWSTFTDEIEHAMVDVMQPFMGYLKDGIRYMIGFAKGAGAMARQVKELVDVVASFSSALAFIPGLLTMIYGPKMLGAVMAFIRAQGILTHSVTAYGRTVQVANTRKEMLAATMGRIKMMGSNMWSGMIKGATSAIGVLGMMQLAAASVYFAYERISAASEKANKETAYHAARKAQRDNEDTINTAKLALAEAKMGKKSTALMRDASTIEIDPKTGLGVTKKGSEVLSKSEIAMYETQLIEAEKKRADLQKQYDRTLREFDPEIFQEQEEQRMTREQEAMKAELQSISNNTKQITNNINNKINIPVTVDDKGETPLSKMALDEIINTTVRSAFSVQLINVMEGV